MEKLFFCINGHDWQSYGRLVIKIQKEKINVKLFSCSFIKYITKTKLLAFKINLMNLGQSIIGHFIRFILRTIILQNKQLSYL